MKFYDNPQCNDELEYYEDLKKITYIKRLFNHYKLTNDLKIRLILNHLIVFTNVFPVEHGVRILFFKIDEKYYPILKPFLLSLSMMPKIIRGIRGKNIITSDIFMDEYVISELRNC
jgi:hypothetical protein